MKTVKTNQTGLKLLTEKEFLRKIDRSLAQAKDGQTHSAEFVQEYLRQEYAL